jgi:hypothetical protein
MGLEYKIRYIDHEKLSEEFLGNLKLVVGNASNEMVHIAYLKQDNDDSVYGFKIKTNPINAWEWDGYLYINHKQTYVLFHIWTPKQLAALFDYLAMLFLEMNIKIDIEEE